MPQDFIDVKFPDDISRGSTGAPGFRTDIIETESGHEDRNIVWSQARHTYDVALGVRSVTDFEALRKLFFVVHARGHSFRFKDWQDYKSCSVTQEPDHFDQLIGDGDGVTTVWPLVKRYVIGAYEYTRRIYKPVAGSVIVAITDENSNVNTDAVGNGAAVVDYDAGTITTSALAVNATVSAGFEFDVPCRFASDELENTYDAFEAGTAQCSVIEVRLT